MSGRAEPELNFFRIISTLMPAVVLGLEVKGNPVFSPSALRNVEPFPYETVDIPKTLGEQNLHQHETHAGLCPRRCHHRYLALVCTLPLGAAVYLALTGRDSDTIAAEYRFLCRQELLSHVCGVPDGSLVKGPSREW